MRQRTIGWVIGCVFRKDINTHRKLNDQNELKEVDDVKNGFFYVCNERRNLDRPES